MNSTCTNHSSLQDPLLTTNFGQVTTYTSTSAKFFNIYQAYCQCSNQGIKLSKLFPIWCLGRNQTIHLPPSHSAHNQSLDCYPFLSFFVHFHKYRTFMIMKIDKALTISTRNSVIFDKPVTFSSLNSWITHFICKESRNPIVTDNSGVSIMNLSSRINPNSFLYLLQSSSTTHSCIKTEVSLALAESKILSKASPKAVRDRPCYSHWILMNECNHTDSYIFTGSRTLVSGQNCALTSMWRGKKPQTDFLRHIALLLQNFIHTFSVY